MLVDLLIKDDYSRARYRQLGNDHIRTGAIACGFGVLCLAAVKLNHHLPPFWIGVFCVVCGGILLMAGCIRHATVKGYGAWVGVLAAITYPIGVPILKRLPDRTDIEETGRGFEVLRPVPVSTTWIDPDNVGRPPPGPVRRPWNLAEETEEEIRLRRAAGGRRGLS